MKEYFNKLPGEVLELVRLACQVSRANKTPAYLVGGFVRDLMLGVENLDLDITVEGDGIKFAEDFSSKLKAKLIRHRRFGTATVVVKPHLKIDFASARKEFYPEPAHLPVVERGSLKDDLFRRDFTINAMALSLNGADFGRLVDFFGGKMDLAGGRIRILHDLSFIDDPTRILRAVRFEKRYDFTIEPKTLKRLKDAVRLKMLEKVEPQRIRDDLILVLKEKVPLKEIKRLQELAGFAFIDKDLSLSKKGYRLLASTEKEIGWFNGNYPNRRQLDTWLIYFMGLLDPLSMDGIRKTCRRFALRSGEEKRILAYKACGRKAIPRLNKKTARPSDVFMLFEPLSYEGLIMLKAKYKGKNIQKHIRDFFRAYNGTRIHISGEDLRGLGISPGPSYQKIFVRVLKARLNGLVKTKEDELALVGKLIKTR